MTEIVTLVDILVVAIILMVIMVSKFKIHPFIALCSVAFMMGIAGGVAPKRVLDVLTEGFGSICKSIGLLIIFGAVTGTMLERSGAIMSMTNAILRKFEGRTSPMLMSVIGWFVCIPAFCDSGFVIISPLNKTLAKRGGANTATLAIALSTGLYATHTLMPPTPGPLAAAQNLQADLLTLTLLGAVVSACAALTGYIYAIKVGPLLKTSDTVDAALEEALSRRSDLPSPATAFAPVVIPILLISVNAVIRYPTILDKFAAYPDLVKTAELLGTPVFASFIGMLLCFPLVPSLSEEVVSGWVRRGLLEGSEIIMITAAGGSLGAIIAEMKVGDYIGNTLVKYQWGVFLPFIISVAIKTAQGSSTVALITTSRIVYPLLDSLGLASPMGAVLATLAIGSGSMVVSHANDSYFWVVSQFSGMDITTAYKAQTLATLLEGITGCFAVWLLSLVLL
jgi:GntP family gluconate:H+ symporter